MLWQGKPFNSRILHVRTYTLFHHTYRRVSSARAIPVTDSTQRWQRRSPLVIIDRQHQRRERQEGIKGLKRTILAVNTILGR